jgi:P27 family predicted phage terminase small subunit
MTEKGYERDIIKKLRALNLYRPEHEYAIKTFAKTLVNYEKTADLWEKSGGQIVIKHTNRAGATNPATNPYYVVLQTIRTEIIEYSRELGLTPAALKKINESALTKTKPSALTETLQKIGR